MVTEQGAGSNDIDDEELLCASVEFIISRSARILTCADYFFCETEPAWCSWPFLSGDGKLPLGFLLLGWTSGTFLATCERCELQFVHLYNFSGSPLSGHYRWTGFCTHCRKRFTGKSERGMANLVSFVIKLRKAYPSHIDVWQEVDGHCFDWEQGLKPTKKRELKTTPVAQAIDLETTLAELVLNEHRQSPPPNIALLKSPVVLSNNIDDSSDS